ncbi:CCHC-type domain-containing protein [Trichonephila clavipes]|nr:CCHC-type domain-containing protein [Trichonephila clavipes]
MELLVKKQGLIRANFTKSKNVIMKKLNADDPVEREIKSNFANFVRIYSDLTELDNQICGFLLENSNDDKYEAEYLAVEEYSAKMTHTKNSVDMYLNKKYESERGSVYPISPQIKRKLKLLKIELVKFNGEIKNWLAFWSQFKRIHDDDKVENEDKFQYLIQSMSEGRRAREIIDSYPPTNENYSKAIESLKSCFGKDELLIEHYVRELLKLVIINATETKRKLNTSQIYDQLETYLRALELIGLTSDKYSAMLFPLVESCIPEDIFRVWLSNPMVNHSKW